MQYGNVLSYSQIGASAIRCWQKPDWNDNVTKHSYSNGTGSYKCCVIDGGTCN